MIELFALLLPVAAASGWWAAKRSARREAERMRRFDVDPAYFRGLNYLVNEQPDKAIDIFVRMLEVNSETVELHLALGNLFRRRGEVDKAIRIHQNLIARPTLSAPQRAQALLELGQDYLRSGLLDRAEGLFNELVELNQLVKPALRNLLIIFQHEKDWQKCLEASRKLENLGDQNQTREQAHYFCELATEAVQHGDLAQASALLEDAEHADPGNLRVSLMRGEIAMARADFRSAIDFFKQVESRHPTYVGEVIEPLAECHQALCLGGEWLAHLREQYDRNPSLALMLALADSMRNRDGDVATIELVTAHLSRKPSLRGLQYLIDLRLAETGENRTDFMVLLKELVDQLVVDVPAYQCHRCGFSARTLHWQCPGCRAWGTASPVTERKEKLSQ